MEDETLSQDEDKILKEIARQWEIPKKVLIAILNYNHLCRGERRAQININEGLITFTYGSPIPISDLLDPSLTEALDELLENAERKAREKEDWTGRPSFGRCQFKRLAQNGAITFWCENTGFPLKMPEGDTIYICPEHRSWVPVMGKPTL